MRDAAILRNDWRARGHAGWWAFAAHRFSGVALAVFLPLHFWVLGQALAGAAALDGFLAWTRQPLVEASEVGLVLLLAVHLTGGLRLLLAEFVVWRAAWQPTLIAAAGGVAALCALLFALNLA
jgi:succinate dehydrogenase subunit D